MDKSYFGKKPINYTKSEYVSKIKKNAKEILNSTTTSSNNKRKRLDIIFQDPKFKDFVNDLKSRVSRLNKEYIIQKSNNHPKVSQQVSTLANALNAYTNQLIGFYEESYYNIPNSNERKRFIRDLKMVIGTYGKLQENLSNIIYNSNNVQNVIKTKGLNVIDSYKSETMKKIETEFIEELKKKEAQKPTISNPITVTSQNKQTPNLAQPTQPTQPTQKGGNIDINLLNNSNNCYRNTVIHLLLTLLRDDMFSGNNIENAFNPNMNDDNCGTKNNLKQFLIKLVRNQPIHPQEILITYNPILVNHAHYKNGPNYTITKLRNNLNGTRIETEYQFTITKKDNTPINSYNELCIYYPNLNTDKTINSSSDYFNIFNNNLIKNININVRIIETIIKGNKKNSQKEIQNNEELNFYVKLIIDTFYRSFGNAFQYLIYEGTGLFESNIFSERFLNNIKINNDTYILTHFGRNYNNLEDLINQSLRNVNFTNQDNKYIIISTGDLVTFKDMNFNNIFTINNNDYEVTDIIYASEGHYVSLNRRNNIWYLYDDTVITHPVKHNTFTVQGFNPNIFLLKKIVPVRS